MRTAFLIAAGATVGSALPQSRVSPLPGAPAYTPLPVGDVVPEGWLLEQLKLQADGLSGHLAMFWNDIQHSIWLNGPGDTGDSGLHERGPYCECTVAPADGHLPCLTLRALRRAQRICPARVPAQGRRHRRAVPEVWH